MIVRLRIKVSDVGFRTLAVSCADLRHYDYLLEKFSAPISEGRARHLICIAS